jgi:hypothetical protein
MPEAFGLEAATLRRCDRAATILTGTLRALFKRILLQIGLKLI